MTVTVLSGITLDGVVQAPARPDEDARDGFRQGGWAAHYTDEAGTAAWGEVIARAASGGGFLLGRWTYLNLIEAWPKRRPGHQYTQTLTSTPKYVASTTLTEPLPWENSILLTDPVQQVAPQAAPGSDAQSVEAELRQASEHYEKAINGLEQIAHAEQGALDPRTAATLQKNLAVIDQAIVESREALHTQPNSEPAQQSLIDNFKTKITLLQDTVALINEMRKGNEAGAARIVSGLKQKG